jgi:hypothetical protein
MASSLYRLLGAKVGNGYANAKADHIFRDLVDTIGHPDPTTPRSWCTSKSVRTIFYSSQPASPPPPPRSPGRAGRNSASCSATEQLLGRKVGVGIQARREGLALGRGARSRCRRL